MRAHRPRPLAQPALAAVLALAGVGLSACAGMDENNPRAPFDPVEVPDIRGAEDLDDAYSGALDARFREDLDAYDGIEVTLLADVAEVFSPRAFTVTSPGDGEVEPVLVVTTADAGDVDPQSGDSLVIAATPVDEFDPDAVAEDLGLDLEEGQVEDWEGETFLLATIVEAAP